MCLYTLIRCRFYVILWTASYNQRVDLTHVCVLVNRKHAIQGVPYVTYVVFTINLTEIDISPTRDLFSTIK